jgi:hypothetical protein
MDQSTGPPLAVRVNEAVLPTASVMLFVLTLSVPAVACGDEVGALLLEPVPEPEVEPEPDEAGADEDEPADDEATDVGTGTTELPCTGSDDAADDADGVPVFEGLAWEGL